MLETWAIGLRKAAVDALVPLHDGNEFAYDGRDGARAPELFIERGVIRHLAERRRADGGGKHAYRRSVDSRVREFDGPEQHDLVLAAVPASVLRTFLA